MCPPTVTELAAILGSTRKYKYITMIQIEKIAENLFDKIRSRFDGVSIGDENAKATLDPEKARFFNFDFSVDDENYGNVTLSLVDNTPATIEVVNMQGVSVYNATANSNNLFVNINLTQLANGVYFIKVTQNGNTTVQKLVKQ